MKQEKIVTRDKEKQEKEKQEKMELTRLFYHLCRKEERNPSELDQILIRRGLANRVQERYLGVLPNWEAEPKEEELFLQVPWRAWSEQNWIALVCHPDFIRQQEQEKFLEELCQLLEQEQVYNLDGISQDLYFALCIAYHFFEEEESQKEADEKGVDGSGNCSERFHLKELLYGHPKHTEYLTDLHTWEELKRDRRLVCFCQKAVILAKQHWLKPKEKNIFLEEAEELFLQHRMPRENFILQNLNDLPGSLSSILLSFLLSRKEKKTQSLQVEGRECFTVFSDLLLDVTAPGHSPYQAGYIPIKKRLWQFQKQSKLQKSLYSMAFLQALKDKMMLPAYSTVYPYVPYIVWRELCQWFRGNTSFEQKATEWLKTAAYFPAYERRFQKENTWRNQQIETAYEKDIFPLPALNQEKKELLEEFLSGTPSEPGEIQLIFHPVSLDSERADRFLNHLTNAMVRFRFFLVTASGDAVCFLKEEVVLYQKKEYRTCRMSHSAFFDMLSRTVDMLAQKETLPGGEMENGKAQDNSIRYTEAFLETICKNLYLYECNIEAKRVSP